MTRKLTMFELHFDGIQIGGSGDGTTRDVADDAEDEATEAGPVEDEGGRSVGRTVLALLATGLVVSYVASKVAKRFDDVEHEADVAIEEIEDGEEALA